MSNIKEKAQFGEYSILRYEDSHIEVKHKGVFCDNTKKELRDIAEQIGFHHEPTWNTRQFGAKLIEYISQNPVGKKETPKVDKETANLPQKPTSTGSDNDKIRVYGKAQNRTALGIINAYLILYPESTYDDLKKAFPADINRPALSAFNYYSHWLVKKSDYHKNPKIQSCFVDDQISLADGTIVYLMMLWQKPEYEKIISTAGQYGITVANYTPTKPFGKGGYLLEYINGYVPSIQTKKKGFSKAAMILTLLAAIIIALLIWFLTRPKETVVVTQTIYDTVYVEKMQDIQTKFNAVQFDFDKCTLKPEAQAVLGEVVELMNDHSEIKLHIAGHTSDEGSAEHNMALSEQRAKAVVDYLIGQGIPSERLSYEGKGSTEPKDINNKQVNRRTEFIIVK